MNLVEYFKQRLVNYIFEDNEISAPPRLGPPPNPPIPVQPGPPRPQGPRPGPTSPGPSRPPRPPGPAPINPGVPRPPRASKIKNVNEARRRYENDPHNYGLPPQPGSLVSHGDIIDKQDIIDHHSTMLRYALQSNDQKAVEKHTKAIDRAGGNSKEIISKLTGQ